MLATYADETGHYADPQRTVVGLAGFLGKFEDWDRFDVEGRTVCREEGVIRPFHMTDFAASTEQFKPWKGNERRRQRLMGRLVAAITNANVFPVGAIVPIEDFKSFTEAQRISLGADPYYVAFQEVTHQMAFGGALIAWPPEPISMVYACLRKYTAKSMELWEAIKTHNLYGHRMSSFAPGDPKDYTPLEAADLWAYELGKHFEYVLPNGRDWRLPFVEIVRYALKKGGGHKFFQLCDRDFMLGVLGELEDVHSS